MEHTDNQKRNTNYKKKRKSKMTCIFIVNGEKRLPTEEEKRIMLDRFAGCLGYTRQEKSNKRGGGKGERIQKNQLTDG